MKEELRTLWLEYKAEYLQYEKEAGYDNPSDMRASIDGFWKWLITGDI